MQRLLTGLLLTGALLLAAAPGWAQAGGSTRFGLAYGSVAKVVQGTDTLAHPWAGGLNMPQLSPIDLDGDGQLDIYAFDRETNRSYTFLNVAAPGGGRRYQLAPDYAAIFPTDLQSWVLLRDYDCDGRADLFTYASGGNIRVFHNVAAAGGRASFVLANPQLSFPIGNGYTSNLIIGYYSLPVIEDLNGDNKLDVLSYDFINSSKLELYLNASPGSCGGISTFSRANEQWGQLEACVGCGSFTLAGGPTCGTYRTAHTQGHNILLLDLNGDGKLDLLDGRDNCASLTRILNTGASTVDAVLAPASASSAFPSAAAPVNLPVFPAAYRFDADFDGVPDLVLAPDMIDNTLDFVGLRSNVQLYHNAAASAGAVPSFGLTNGSFLQGDMLDVSEGAMAAFGDLDGDGLPDMLIGNYADNVNGYYRANLSYYRNVGTAHRPVYRLASADYLGLGAATAAAGTTLLAIRPALVDLNRDGKLDLVYSAYNGTTNRLNYLLNTAAAGQPAVFSVSQASYFKPQGAAGSGVLPARQNDTPCFYDVDGDGYVDLLLGTNDGTEPGGSLRYFRNQGAAAAGNVDNLFVLADNDFGQLRNGTDRPANLAPTVTDFDGDGQPDLLTADALGNVKLYLNFKSQTGAFTARTDVLYNTLTATYGGANLGYSFSQYGTMRLAVTTADLNQDGTPELYLGTETGGLVSLLPGTRPVALATQPAAAAALAFSLYPNPARRAATAETAQPTRLRLLDLTGRQVLADATLARTHQLDLSSLAAGVYIAQATAADGTSTSRRLAVSE